MKKILAIFFGLCLLLPFVNAGELIYSTINVTLDDGNVTIKREHLDEIKTWGPRICDVDDEDYELDIVMDREDICEESEIADLTKELIEVNKETVKSCGGNLSKEYVVCIEARARAEPIHQRCRDDRDEYRNQSTICTSKLTTAVDNSSKWFGEWDSCETSIGNLRKDLNDCKDEKEEIDGQKWFYLIFGALGGIIVATIYHKGKMPKPREIEEFGDQGEY